MFFINPKITFRDLDDAILIITPWDQKMHTLEFLGREIFLLMKESKTKDEILNYIIENYDVSKDIAEQDLNSFLNELIKKNIFNV
ncbi:PqqD family protein [bacterium]|nr:PqqD family protein [bacterium]